MSLVLSGLVVVVCDCCCEELVLEQEERVRVPVKSLSVSSLIVFLSL